MIKAEFSTCKKCSKEMVNVGIQRDFENKVAYFQYECEKCGRYIKFPVQFEELGWEIDE